MKGAKFLKRVSVFLYAAIFAALCLLFFTNDFGLVDLRKTSVIIGVGIDCDEEEVTLTAQLAVPRPAENGDNTQFAVVEGKGETIARALNDINLKTGFYPKLVFCKLIVVGESCLSGDVNAELNYFYNNEFTGLTPKIAACEGTAKELMSLSLPFGDSTTDAIDRLLSDEAKKSANVSAVNLNDFGQAYYSKSGAAYMPYIRAEDEEPTKQDESGSSSSGGEQYSSATEGEVTFDCGKTALFQKGVFKGLLEKEQAFAFNLLNGKIRRAFISGGDSESAKTLGIRHCKGGAELKVEGGVPVLKLSFTALAEVQDIKGTGESAKAENIVEEDVLKTAEDNLKENMLGAFYSAKNLGCDLFGAAELLYKTQNKYYEALKDTVLENLSVVCDVKLTTVR